MRKCDQKIHTIGYKIGGRWHTRKQAVALAKKGRLEGVRAYRRSGIDFIKSLPGYTNLYDLDYKVEA